MSTTTKTALPKLRFPEFEQAEAWEEKTLGEVAEITKGSQLNKITLGGGAFPVINGGMGPSGYHSEFNRNKNTITISEGGNSCGFVNFMKENFWSGGHNYTLKLFDNELNFIYQLLKFNEEQIKKLRVGSGLPNIQLKALNKYLLTIPTLPEQEKIAATLCSLDELIDANNTKLEALKTHKQGLMQQLFPAPGEKVPRLRFPEFANAGDWEEKTLGEVTEINPKSKELPNEFIYIDLESVETGKLKNRKIIQKEGAPSRAQRLVKKNDILFQMVRSYQQNNLFVDFEDELSFVASTGYAQIRTKENSLCLFYALHTSQFLNSVVQLSTGSNYPAINSDQLSKLEISLPSLPEQEKIAACLSSLDESIAAQSQKIEALQEYKRGLMQGLFPV